MHFVDIVSQGLESESKFAGCTKDLLYVFELNRCCIVSFSQDVLISFGFYSFNSSCESEPSESL